MQDLLVLETLAHRAYLQGHKANGFPRVLSSIGFKAPKIPPRRFQEKERMVECLTYCLDKVHWKAIDYLKERVWIVKEQQEKGKRIHCPFVRWATPVSNGLVVRCSCPKPRQAVASVKHVTRP